MATFRHRYVVCNELSSGATHVRVGPKQPPPSVRFNGASAGRTDRTRNAFTETNNLAPESALSKSRPMASTWNPIPITTRDEAGRESSRETNASRLERVRALTRVLDQAFQVPGTSFRVGLDSLIGLIPGVGDAATAIVSGWIIREAKQAGAPRSVLLRMTANVAIDLVAGSIPLVGDAFDFYWKSNVRNLQLLEKHLERAGESGG